MPFLAPDPPPGEEYGGSGSGGGSPFAGGGVGQSPYGGGGYAGFQSQGFAPYGRRRPRYAAQAGQSNYQPWGGGMGRAPAAMSQWGGDYGQAGSPSTPDAGGDWGGILSAFGGGSTGGDDAFMTAILGGHGQGAFSPGGDPGIWDAYQRDSRKRGLDAEQAAVLGADLGGGDPWTRGLAQTLARNNAQRTEGDFYNNNALANANAYNELVRQIMAAKFGKYNAQQSNIWGREDQGAQNARENKMFPWQVGGQLVGAGIAAYGSRGGKGKSS